LLLARGVLRPLEEEVNFFVQLTPKTAASTSDRFPGRWATGTPMRLCPVEALIVALIGVFGGLVGVIITEVRRARSEERRAKERLRGAARMIWAELGIAAATVETDRPFFVLATLPIAAWQAHGPDIARALSDDDFYVVVEATAKVEAARSLGGSVTDRRAKVHGPPADKLAELGEMCRRAQDVLSPLAYPNSER
jgi:hypothetical protein